MKYVFFGTPRFAEIVLKGLLAAGMPPIAVVCNPDRPIGRKKILTAPPTKKIAEEHGISVFQPEHPIDIKADLAALNADFFVVAAYAKLLPHELLRIPSSGAIGAHPSLLPRYRGASPIQSAILAGETETGATIYLMDEKMDHGPIVATAPVALSSTEVYPEAEEKLAKLSAALLVKTLPAFLNGQIMPKAQDETLATFTGKFKTEDAFIGPEDFDAAERGDTKKASDILRKINAFDPEPGAWTMKDGKRIKLLKAAIENGRLVIKEKRS